MTGQKKSKPSFSFGESEEDLRKQADSVINQMKGSGKAANTPDTEPPKPKPAPVAPVAKKEASVSKTEKLTVMIDQDRANRARKLAVNNKIDNKPHATVSAILDYGLSLALSELEK